MAPPLTLYVKGAVPVKAILRFALPPIQIEVVPVMVEVGRGLAVIVAAPVKSPLMAVHFESLRPVARYVVVIEGLTFMT